MSILSISTLYFRLATRILHEGNVTKEVLLHLSSHHTNVHYHRYHCIILAVFILNIVKFLLLTFYMFTWRERVLLGDITVALSGIYHYNCFSFMLMFIASGSIYYLFYFNHEPYVMHIVRPMLFPDERKNCEESHLSESLTKGDLIRIQTINKHLNRIAIGFVWIGISLILVLYLTIYINKACDWWLVFYSLPANLIMAFAFHQVTVLLSSLALYAFFFQFYLCCSFDNFSQIWIRNLIEINRRLSEEEKVRDQDQWSRLCVRRDRVLGEILRHERDALYAMLKKSGRTNKILFYAIIIVLPISLLWLYQVMFEDLSIQTQIFFSLGVTCSYVIFGIALQGFAKTSARLHHASGPLAQALAIHFKAQLPLRFRLLFKWSQCYERLHNRRKVTFTLGGVTRICTYTFFRLFMYYAHFMIMTYKIASKIKR